MPNDARTIVREVLSFRRADEIWSALYDKALPITINDFALSAILPAVLYMFRFGHRRGQGAFLKTFAAPNVSLRDRRRTATVERVAEKLAARDELIGFEGDAERTILGDLLLCFILENIRHDIGRDKQIQRVAPAHYMASWVDLPESVAHLRFVPEMIVAMLADQKGEYIEPTEAGDRTWFSVARFPQVSTETKSGEDSAIRPRNLLLEAFSQGITRRTYAADRRSDPFEESDTSVGLDQLLMIRLAQELGVAPDKLRGKDLHRISNQRPIAKRAAEEFSDDIQRFVRSYASVVPRHAFVDLLESCVTTGMTAVLTSVIEILIVWSETGVIPERHCQHPASIFVDCSKGVDIRLRRLAEQSLDDLTRRIERLPSVLMMLRLLDYAARHNAKIKRQQIASRPYATDWLNMLGSVLHDKHDEASYIHRTMEDDCERLADALQEAYPEAAETLRDDQNKPNSIRRLAEALTPLLGPKFRKNTFTMVDSTLHVGHPNGLAQKRKTSRGTAGGRKQRDVRSLVFTESVLDYLVHLHLLRPGDRSDLQTLSLRDFLKKLRERYGFHVDIAPPGMTISNELLQSNYAILERRLRDLGLLVGVNDAAAMKRLKPRFRPRTER